MEHQTKILKIVLKDCLKTTDSPRARLTTNTSESDFAALCKVVLENELVLDIIFQNFVVSSANANNLTTCRQICKTWKPVATRKIQKKKKNWNLRNFLELPNVNTIRKYVNTISSCSGSPENEILFSCYNLKFQHKYIKKKSKPSSPKTEHFVHEEVEKLFKLLEQQIGSLVLTFDFIQQPRNLLERLLKTQATSLCELKICVKREKSWKNGFYQMNQKIQDEDFILVNLTTLCFTIDSNSIMQLPIAQRHAHKTNEIKNLISVDADDCLMQIIFNKIPKNQPLKLSLIKWEDLGITIPVLQRNEQIKNLKVLQPSALESGELRVLANSGVQLQFLSLSNRVNDFDLDMVKEYSEFIATQANCLESLSLENIPMDFKFKFPARMPNLKKLRLRFQCTTNLEHILNNDPESESENEEGEQGHGNSPEVQEWLRTCVPILYDHVFPKLEELEIYIEGITTISTRKFLSWVIPPQFPCSTLKKLIIDHPRINADVMTRISSTFPCIKSLDIGCAEDLMYDQWIANRKAGTRELEFFVALWNADFALGLEELTLHLVSHRLRQSYQFDRLFSGVSTGKIRQITESEDEEIFQSGIEIECEQPSILNPKSLKKLIIYNEVKDEECNPGVFTDFSALWVFGDMENLNFLHIDKHVRQFSKSALKHLKTKSRRQCQSSSPTVSVASPENYIDEAFKTSFSIDPEKNDGGCRQNPRSSRIGRDLINLLD